MVSRLIMQYLCSDKAYIVTKKIPYTAIQKEKKVTKEVKKGF